MRRRLSRGVRIYLHVHCKDAEELGVARTRANYNYEQGVAVLAEYRRYPWRIVAVGSEGGAMVAHLLWVG